MTVPDHTPLPPTELADPPLPLAGDELERIPERIGAFRILDLIARGMAVVYKAEQQKPRRLVALKIPRGGRLLGAETRARFLREMELAARLHHSAIVPVLETGEVDGVPFYTMPFIEGRSLAGHIATTQAPRAERLALFLKICQVVQALHAAGLIHRDLKPENILIDRFGDVRLLDFGLARALAEEDGISGHHLIGTLQYMAPEQTLPPNQTKLTPAADVYALGLILYQLLTDRLPYKTEGALAAAVSIVREAAIEPPSRVRPELGKVFDEVVLACLEKDPARRPRTAGDLAARLQAVQPVSAGPGRERLGRHLAMLCATAVVLVGLVLVLQALWPRGGAEAHPAAQGGASDERPPAPALLAEPGAVQDAPAAPRIELLPVDERVAGTAPPGSASLPRDRWSAFSRAQATLRDTYALRRCGAVLIRVTLPGELAWGKEGAAAESAAVPLSVDQIAILYAPPGPIEIRWTDGQGAAARLVTVQGGKIEGITLGYDP